MNDTTSISITTSQRRIPTELCSECNTCEAYAKSLDSYPLMNSIPISSSRIYAAIATYAKRNLTIIYDIDIHIKHRVESCSGCTTQSARWISRIFQYEVQSSFLFNRPSLFLFNNSHFSLFSLVPKLFLSSISFICSFLSLKYYTIINLKSIRIVLNLIEKESVWKYVCSIFLGL